MNCPRCKSRLKQSVVKTVSWLKDEIIRYRVCESCGRPIRTREMIEEDATVRIQKPEPGAVALALLIDIPGEA